MIPGQKPKSQFEAMLADVLRGAGTGSADVRAARADALAATIMASMSRLGLAVVDTGDVVAIERRWTWHSAQLTEAGTAEAAFVEHAMAEFGEHCGRLMAEQSLIRIDRRIGKVPLHEGSDMRVPGVQMTMRADLIVPEWRAAQREVAARAKANEGQDGDAR